MRCNLLHYSTSSAIDNTKKEFAQPYRQLAGQLCPKLQVHKLLLRKRNFISCMTNNASYCKYGSCIANIQQGQKFSCIISNFWPIEMESPGARFIPIVISRMSHAPVRPLDGPTITDIIPVSK